MLPRREIARYLGYGGASPEPATEALAAACEAELFARCRPRRTARKLPLSALPFWGESGDLQRHLQGCTEVYLTALTLGAEADGLLRRFSAESVAKAAVGQACAAAWMDLLCEEHHRELESLLPEGHSLLPPFSPGYGDFALTCQSALLRLLSAERLGLSLSGGGMLLPQKSVTAVIGISPTPQRHPPASCEGCPHTDCPFRAEGKGDAPCG